MSLSTVVVGFGGLAATVAAFGPLALVVFALLAFAVMALLVGAWLRICGRAEAAILPKVEDGPYGRRLSWTRMEFPQRRPGPR